jgi:group I intron endonuclease
MERRGCLYRATSPSGRAYVGITTQGAEARWQAHAKEAARGDKTPLNSAIRKHGAKAFRLEVLAVVDWEELNRLEPLTIKLYQTRWPQGYNLREGGSQSSPHPRSSAQQAAKLRGRQWTEEHRAKHAAAMKTEETRQRLREARQGQQITEETRAKMRAAHAKHNGRPYSKGMTGRQHRPETIQKMRASAIARRDLQRG